MDESEFRLGRDRRWPLSGETGSAKMSSSFLCGLLVRWRLLGSSFDRDGKCPDTPFTGLGGRFSDRTGRLAYGGG